MRKVRHYCFFLGFFVFLLAGCRSTTVVEPAIIEHQRQLSEYQGAVEGFVRRAGECAGEIDRIRGRADGITGEIDGVISLFDEYQRAVERLIQEYNRLRDEIENINKGDGDAFGGAACAYPPENSRLCPLFQGNPCPPVAGYIALNVFLRKKILF